MRRSQALSQEEQQRPNVISLLKAYIETEEPERIADFTEMIFSFISEYQKKYPEKSTDANNISEIFEEAIDNLPVFCEQDDSELLEEIYPFLSAAELYLSNVLGIFIDDKESEYASLITELTNEYEVSPDFLPDYENSSTLVATNAKKVFDFVCLLRQKIGNRFVEQATSEYEDIFKEGIYNGLSQALILLKEYNDFHRRIDSGVEIVTDLEKPLVKKDDAVSSLKENLDVRGPDSLTNFVKTIFSILLEKQAENPSKLLKTNAIRDLFSETAILLLALYKENNSKRLEALYKFLLAMESYIHAEKEVYATNKVDEKKFMSNQVVCHVHKLVDAFTGGSHVENRSKDEEAIRNLLYEHLVRLWRFVFALREEIENRSNRNILEKHDANFKKGFKRGIRRASNIRKKKDKPAPRKSRWKRFKESWKALSLKWKILTGIFIALEITAIVVCAIVFPLSVLVTVPGGAAITTNTVIMVSGTVSIAGTATAHVVHISMTESSRINSNDIKTQEQIKHEPFIISGKAVEDEEFIGLDRGAVVVKVKPNLSGNQSGIFYHLETHEPFVVEAVSGDSAKLSV